MAGAARCFHCKGPIPPGYVLEAVTGGEATARFCCSGCHGAYLLITGTGLDDYYQRRRWQEPGLPSRAFQQIFDDGYLSRFTHPTNKGSVIDIIIEGIRCASCVWLNEKVIGGLPGVSEVRVNYATGRARVTFEPTTVTPSGIFAGIARLGYVPRPYTRTAATAQAAREHRELLFRFGTAVFLSMQLMAYSFALYAGYLQGIDGRAREYLQLFSLLVTTPIIFYCGYPFLAGGWRSLRNRTPNMELLISLGSLSSFGYSVYATFAGGEVYYETAAMIVTLVLAGRLLENAARRKATAGVEHLLELCPAEARRFRGETLEVVDPCELEAGDHILVAAGGRFPVDGEIVEGRTEVDQSAATGEAVPVAKGPGDEVLAGTCNLTGVVRVCCRREASDSFLARVARLVEEAQSRRAAIQGLADRVSAIFVPVVVCLSAATFGWRLASGEDPGAALMCALAVLVVACPCALGLATPTAMVAGTGAAAVGGVIIKGGDVLERLSRVNTVIFDKTGTITCGKPEVIGVHAASGEAEKLLSLAASVEMGSLHPVGKAIVESAAARGLAAAVAREITVAPGGGVFGKVEGEEVCVGTARFLRGLKVAGVPSRVEAPAGCMVVCVSRAGSYHGSLVLRDRLRNDAAKLVSYFREAGMGTALLSGDRQAAATEAAALVGIEQARGLMSPAAKAAQIEELRRQGGVVLMVGDGINDAPALSAADVGCAVAGGTDLAIETSSLVLVKADLQLLSLAHRIACRTMTVVRQNLAWAFLYNAVGIPLAMAGKLTPVAAAAAMAVSSLGVVGNSLRLRRTRRG